MGVLAALTVGYLLGARTGTRDLEQLRRSLQALCGTDEFADVVTAVRSHVGQTLRELASIIDGDASARSDSEAGLASSPDLVDRVWSIVGRGHER